MTVVYFNSGNIRVIEQLADLLEAPGRGASPSSRSSSALDAGLSDFTSS